MSFKPKSGITEETRVVALVPFPVSNENYIQLAQLEEVNYVERVREKPAPTLLPGVPPLEKGEKPNVDQVTRESLGFVIQFVFKSKDNAYGHIEEKWYPTDDDIKADTKERMFNEQVAHIFAAFMGAAAPPKFLGIQEIKKGDNKGSYEFAHPLMSEFGPIKDNGDYVKGLALMFNIGKEGNPVFKTGETYTPVRIKLTRATKTKRPNQLQLGTGNVIEVYEPNATVSILSKVSGDIFDPVPETPKPSGPTITTPAGGNPATPSGGGGGWPSQI